MLDNFERDDGLQHFQRALALERVNRISEAVEEYRQAVARYPHLREAHLALGFYYQRNGLLAKAADEFHIATRLEGDFLSFFNLGHLLVELGRHEEALEALRQCLNQEPGDAPTHYEIARLHFSCGCFREALSHLHIPLHCYADDWDVYILMGQCYLGLHDYAEALNLFEQALVLAPTPQSEAEVLEHIATVERFREFRADVPLHLKDRLYAQHGVVFLGSACDDGLDGSIAEEYHLTYPDIAVTLHRFVSLLKSSHWQLTAIVAADMLAQPVARSLARLLRLPLRLPQAIAAEDRTLLVLAVGRVSELMSFTLDHLPGHTVSFCLGVNWLRHSDVLPNIIGVMARWLCSVPWEPELARLQANGSSRDQTDACIGLAEDEIGRAMEKTVPDPNIALQVYYYTRWHRRLGFC